MPGAVGAGGLPGLINKVVGTNAARMLMGGITMVVVVSTGRSAVMPTIGIGAARVGVRR